MHVCMKIYVCVLFLSRHPRMRNGRISEERPLDSAASTLAINNALLGNRWGNAEISPALRTHLLFLLERHIGLP